MFMVQIQNLAELLLVHSIVSALLDLPYVWQQHNCMHTKYLVEVATNEGSQDSGRLHDQRKVPINERF